MSSCIRNLGASRGPLLLTVLVVGAFTILCAVVDGIAAQSSQFLSVHPDEFQQVPGFIVLADRRMFAVMAFLNAVGYDSETSGSEMLPLRVKVRQLVAANLRQNPQKLSEWRRTYARYVKARILLPAYQDYALRACE